MLQVALPYDFLLEGMNVQWVHKCLFSAQALQEWPQNTGFSMFYVRGKKIKINCLRPFRLRRAKEHLNVQNPRLSPTNQRLVVHTARNERASGK